MDTDIKNAEKLIWHILVLEECLCLQVNGSEHVFQAVLQWRDDVVAILKQAAIDSETFACMRDMKTSEDHCVRGTCRATSGQLESSIEIGQSEVRA